MLAGIARAGIASLVRFAIFAVGDGPGTQRTAILMAWVAEAATVTLVIVIMLGGLGKTERDT